MRKLLCVLSLTCAALAPAATAEEATVRAGVRIVAVHSLKCLDVAGASLDDGAPVVQYACHFGHHQAWELWPLDFEQHVQIRAAHSGKCLDVAQQSTDLGALLVQQPCTGSPSQQWVVAPDGGISLVVQHSQKCAEVDGGSTADGAALLQWSCSPSRAQDFVLAPGVSATAG